MAKPAFDPNQPFQSSKPAFDPNQAFTPGDKPQDSGNPGAWQTAKNIGKAGLDYGLRAFDYAGGLTRTAAYGALSPVASSSNLGGPGEVVTGDDVVNALKGKAPSSAEYMDRMGIPEGAKVNLPLVGPISARGVGGFVSDVALDPLTYATLGGSAIAKEAAEKAAAKGVATQALEQGVKQLPGKAAKEVGPSTLQKISNAILTPASRATEAAGDSMYKSGFKTVDAKLAAQDAAPLSDVLFRNGRPSGTSQTISDAVDQLVKDKMAQRQAMYDAINTGGGNVDVLAATKPSIEKAKDILRRDPNAGDQIASMEGWLGNYLNQGQHVPVDLASDWKSRIYNATLPANAYAPNGRTLAAPLEMKQQFARGLKEGIENAAERTLGPGQGAVMSGINSDTGTLLKASERALPSEVLKGANKNMITSVDAMNGGIQAALHENPIKAVPYFLAKKGVDAYNTMAGRTIMGNALSTLGQSRVPDLYLRREFIDMNQSPWTSMNNSGGNQ